MKILHINCNYASTVLHRKMIEHLNEFGVESCVYVPVYKKTDDVVTSGAKVIVSECFRRWHRIFFDYKQSRIINDIQSKLDVSQYEAIHAYTLYTDGNCARRLSRKFGIPFAVAVRDTDLNVFLKKVFYLRKRAVKILNDASVVFFLSENYRTQLLERYVPQKFHKEIYEKSYVIPNGIDDFWLDNRYTDKLKVIEDTKNNIRNKVLKVIFAGTICDRKNPLATQEALRILRSKGWTVSFTVVGRILNQDLFDKMVDYPDTHYAGQQPKEKLIEYYRESDIFVMPSHTETFGLVYSEAMTQGLPVLYTRGQGFDGQFNDGEVGFAVDDKNPVDIAEKIVAAAEKYEELSENALKLADKFKWADICEKYMKIYSERFSGRS